MEGKCASVKAARFLDLHADPKRLTARRLDYKPMYEPLRLQPHSRTPLRDGSHGRRHLNSTEGETANCPNNVLIVSFGEAN